MRFLLLEVLRLIPETSANSLGFTRLLGLKKLALGPHEPPASHVGGAGRLRGLCQERVVEALFGKGLGKHC